MKRALAMLLAALTFGVTAAPAFAEKATPEDGLSFGAVDNTELQDGVLTPGEEYRFPILITENGETAELTEEKMEGHNLRLESLEGKDNLESAKVMEISGKYYFEIKVKAGWPTKQSDVKYKLRYISKTDGKTVYTTEVSFATGYETASDLYIGGLAEGDYIQVDNDRPVFTKEQLEKIAELNGYQKVTFTNGDWTFTANITDMDNINMLSNMNAVQEIIAKFDGFDFKFVTFPAGTEFKGNASLTIDVSDIAEDFSGKFYVYRYLNGKLTKMDFSFSEEDETITLNTNKLGRFVISDQEIADGTVIFGDGADNESGSNTGSGSGSNDGKPNPDTGAGNMPAIAMSLMAVAGLAGFATVGKKK